MGIPAFYRWLNERYPLSVVDVIEEEAASINGVEVPIDSSRPNPNGVEFDNLYLDMNGIIHPCFHPDGMEAPKSYEEVFTTVFKYIDRIFAIVRPRKLLYMAIDGVAPRAKMNQQRTRRFRTAKDAADAADAVAKDVKVFESEAAESSVLASNVLDSNVITPGTEFMASLTSALQYYICLRMNTDPGWQGIKVILSDANVPGEGEHKIMSYIRLQRNLPGFDPNTRHCLYGLDADLIMLALATHEVHFSILREDVRNISISSKDIGKKHKECKWELGNMGNEDYITRQKFQFLNIWILRDYLWLDMAIPDLYGADLERLIDDFVFMCIFVGNDFLPHVPSLEISEGAIDLLMNVYKKEFAQKGCYLTDSFRVNLENVEHFIHAVGSYEKAIFKRRSQVKRHHESRLQGHANHGSSKESLTKKNFWSSFDFTQSPKDPALQSSDHKPGSSVTPDGTSVSIDNIKLGEEGWKMRFYAEKFETENEEELGKIQTHAVLKYIEGICWVMHYYYQGVCSWQWFYPYHYAPFASDFNGLDHLEIHFTLGEPFKPFDQLMGVLPAASAHALPLYYRKLMSDSSSPILDFYPADFELDMNGKRFSWQAICKLPFIEESRLLAEIAKVEHTLTDEEKQRNSLGRDVLFVHILNPLAAKIFSFYKRKKDHPKLSIAKVRRKINAKVSGGMNGFMYISDKAVWPPEICSPIGDMETITANKVISVYYNYPPTHPHIPRPPEGVVIPKKAVTKSDILPAPVLWHEKSAIFERAASERYIRNSISGSRLTKLAHRLVVKYYLQEKAESVKHDTKIVPDDNSVQANMENMIHDKYVESGERSCMNDAKMPNDRDASDGQKIICHPNLMVQEKEVDETERGCMNDAQPRKKRHRDTGDGEIVTCPSNSEGMAHKKKVDGDERSCMSGAEPGKRKHSDAGDGQSIKPKKRRKSRNIALEEPILSC